MRHDFYGALNVTINSNTTEISKKYRRLAIQYHPDKLQHLSKSEQKKAEATFKEIAEAKEILVNDETRAAYDKVISGLPRFARPKYGSRSMFDKERLKLGPLFVIIVCVLILLVFVTINQRVNQLSDKASMQRSEYFQKWLKQKRKVSKENRYKEVSEMTESDSDKYFKNFQLEEMVVFREGWEYTLLGRWWRVYVLRKGPPPLSIAEVAHERIKAKEAAEEAERATSDSPRKSDSPWKGNEGNGNIRQRGKGKGKK